MKGKIIVSAISVILVVGVVVGVVAGVHKFGTGTGSGSSDTEKLSPQMKAISTVCAPTENKELCIRSLSNVAPNGTTDPKELIKAAIVATLDEVQKNFNFTQDLVVNASSAPPPYKMAVEDCRDLIQFAVDQLESTLSVVGDSDLHTINDRVADLQTWLSSVVAYQETCFDGLDDPALKSNVQSNMLDATQLTSNALTIVADISKILSSFDLKLKIPNGNSRRLLNADGYPTWFSAADRKLLAKVDNRGIRPNVVVAKDGSGNFRTIKAALDAIPKNRRGRFIIYIKAGMYDEYLTVTKDQTNIFMYGDGPRRTIITGHKSKVLSGYSTWQSATFSAIGNGFLCKGIGFQNTAGYRGEQAVALRVQSDFSAFFNCRIDGYQDSLYVQTNRQFYRNCVISGTIDFIFGDSACVIQNSLIIVRKGGPDQFNTVTAQGRAKKDENTGLVIHNSRIVPEQKLFAGRFQVKSYLGRPWKQYALTVFMETTIGDFIRPEGYTTWGVDNTCAYYEYGNRGPGARFSGRVKWRNVRLISRREALKFTVGSFLQGGSWLRYTGFPHMLGLRY